MSIDPNNNHIIFFHAKKMQRKAKNAKVICLNIINEKDIEGMVCFVLWAKFLAILAFKPLRSLREIFSTP